jgi:hypothetical protein
MRIARVCVVQAGNEQCAYSGLAALELKTVQDLFFDAVDCAKRAKGRAWEGVWELMTCKVWTGANGTTAFLPPDDAMDVPWRLWATVAEELDATHFKFCCKGEEGRGLRRDAEAAGLRVDAFQVLMAKKAAVSLCESDHADAKIFQFRAWQKLVALLANRGCVFSSQESKEAAVSPLWKYCGVLVVLDGHWNNLYNNSLKRDAAGFAELVRLGFVNREARVFRLESEAKEDHHTGPLRQTILQRKEDVLLLVFSQPFWRLEKWADTAALLRVVLLYTEGYRLYLEQQAEARRETRLSYEQARPAIVAGKKPVVYHMPSMIVNERYSDLEEFMENEAHLFQIVDLAPFTDDLDRKRRFEYLSELHLSQCFAHYVYNYGGRKKSLNLIWLTDDDQMENAQREDFCLTQCAALVKQFYTRKIHKRLVKALDDLCGVNCSKAKILYALHSVGIVVDDGHSDRDKYVWLMGLTTEEREEHIMHGGDLTVPKPSKFEEFFELVAAKLSGALVGVNATDRRHSTAVVVDMAPVARSVRGCYHDILCDIEASGSKVAVPSWPLFFYSFQAPHPGRVSRHTGRLPFRLLQSHKTLRVDNVDGHWVAAFWRDFKFWIVTSEWREKIDVFSQDDKALVQCGPPGIAVRALQGPQHKALQQAGAVSNAADHDAVGRSSFVPSVTLLINTPEEEGGSWCSGIVALTVKDSTLEPSSPLRHLCEAFDKNTKLAVNVRQRPIQVHFADGGADHHIGHAKVQLSWLMYFLHYAPLGLDCVICLRCAGGLSWVNPAERVMAALNLGLYGVSLSRDKLDNPVMERRLEGAGGNKARRLLLNEFPEMRQKWTDAIARPRKELCDLLAQVEYSEEKVKVVSVSDSSATVKGLSNLLASLCRVSYDKETSKSLLDNADYQAFAREHIVGSPYCFVVVKCGKADCRFPACGQSTLSNQALTRLRETVLRWPHPVEDAEREGHYKPASLYSFANGSERAGYNAPSSQFADTLLLARSDESAGPYLKQANIFGLVACARCRKPRLIYSSSKKGDANLRQLLKDVEGEFKCGSTDVVDFTLNWKTADGKKIWCFTHPGLTCGIPLEPHYFKHVWPAKKKGGPSDADKRSRYPLCYACGSRVAEFEMDPKGEKPKYLPLCGGCRLAGRAAVTAKEYKLKKGTFDSIFE